MMRLEVALEVPGRVTASFTATQGEVIAVVGPNGAGKSSLLAALAGTVPATGRATLTCAGETRNLLSLPASERRIGMVFQSGVLFPHLTCAANVAYGPRSRGATKAAAMRTATQWLERLGVGEFADRRPGQLSGGQAQRVSIARALACAPDLLLLDEPLNGLDVTVATALRIELAHHLADFDGITLLVAHDALDALTLASRIIVLDQGRVVQDGPAHVVAQQPATPHVARLLGLNVVHLDETLATFSPDAIALSIQPPLGSPRHRWQGTVAALAPYGHALRVLLRTDVGDLIADVTPAAATELGLVPGRSVWLAVKETAVRRTSDAG